MTTQFDYYRLKRMRETAEIWSLFPRCCICGGRIPSALLAIPSSHRPNRVIHRTGCSDAGAYDSRSTT